MAKIGIPASLLTLEGTNAEVVLPLDSHSCVHDGADLVRRHIQALVYIDEAADQRSILTGNGDTDRDDG